MFWDVVFMNRDVLLTRYHHRAWWRHQMETQRPVTRSFDVFFDMRLNKRLSKQSCGWWFETQSRPLWRHSNGILWNPGIFTSSFGGNIATSQHGPFTVNQVLHCLKHLNDLGVLIDWGKKVWNHPYWTKPFCNWGLFIHWSGFRFEININNNDSKG